MLQALSHALSQVQMAQREAEEGARHAWEVAQKVEEAEGLAKDTAERSVLRFSELKGALGKQAATHKKELNTMIAARD